MPEFWDMQGTWVISIFRYVIPALPTWNILLTIPPYYIQYSHLTEVWLIVLQFLNLVDGQKQDH